MIWDNESQLSLPIQHKELALTSMLSHFLLVHSYQVISSSDNLTFFNKNQSESIYYPCQ